MQTRAVNSKTDEVLFIISAIFFCLSLFLILDEKILFKLSQWQRGNLVKVATLEAGTNDVRRRVATDITWFPLFKSEICFDGDSLFTGKESEATVKFTNGNSFAMDQESLVRLEKPRDEVRINILAGNITGKIKNENPMFVTIGRETFLISGKKALFQVDRRGSGDFGISALSGTVHVDTASGRRIKIKNGQLALFKSGYLRPEIQSYQVMPISPINNSSILRSNEVVEFFWKTELSNKPLEFQLAKDRDFKDLVMKTKNPTMPLKLETQDLNGTYFWRLTDQNGIPQSATFKLNLVGEKGPILIRPKDGDTLAYGPQYKALVGSKQEALYEIALRWGYRGSPQEVEVQVAADSNFATRLTYFKAQGWDRNIALPEGRYYWRVRTVQSAEKKSRWSSPFYMVVRRSLERPEIKSLHQRVKLKNEPRSGSNFFKKLWEWLIMPSAEADEAVTSVNLNWQPVPYSSGYQIEIGKDPQLKEIVLKKKTKVERFNWGGLKPGIYYWRVRAINGLGELQPASAIAELSLLVDAPKIVEEPKFLASKKVRLEWEAVRNITSYLVETSENGTFSDAHKYMVRDATFLELEIKKDIVWRVTPLGGNGKSLGDTSKTGKIALSQIEKSKTLEELYFSLPRNGAWPSAEYFDYELTKGGDIKVGNLTWNTQSFRIKYLEPNAVEVSWPGTLAKKGKIEIREGEKILEEKIVTQDKEIAGLNEPTFSEKIEFKPEVIATLYHSQNLNFCLKNSEGSATMEFCSKQYKFVNKGGQYFLEARTELKPQLVIAGNKKAASKGSFVVDVKDKPVFEVFTKHGDHLTINLVPAEVDYKDIVQNNSEVYLKGSGAVPRMTNTEGNSDFWKTQMSIRNPKVYLWGPGQFYVLRQDFKFGQKLPTEAKRMFRLADARKSTYEGNAPLRVFPPSTKNEKREIESVEAKVEKLPEKEEYQWSLLSSQKDQINRRHISYADNTGKYTMYYDMFRGYPFEVGAKLGLLRATESGGFLMLGQLSGTAWLEQIAKWEDNVFSIQRWGVSATFQNYFSIIKAAEGDMLIVNDVGLRYRFEKGIKDYDSGLGLSITHQWLSQEGESASLLGAGLFWSGKFPKFLENLFNKIDFFKFKKWFEVRAEYYPVSLTPGAQVAQNFLVSAEGKIFFDPQFFFLLGGEFRYYDLELPDFYQMRTSALSLTAGIGLHF